MMNSIRADQMWGFDFTGDCDYIHTEAGDPEGSNTLTYTHTRQSRVSVVVIEVDPQQEVLQMGLIAFVHQFGHHCKREA